MSLKMRIFAPTGCLGYGFADASLEDGIRANPDFIGMDAGSSDPGPAYLGSGESFTSRDAVARDLDRILPAAKKAGIPVIIGTAGGAGGNPHVDLTLDIVREVAKRRSMSLKVAVIRSEFDKQTLSQAFREGRISPLPGAPTIDESTIEAATRVVGMMGIEPFQAALDTKADLILAGRACDASIFAAAPVAKGIPRGIALHAAKIIQCGNGAVEHRLIPDGMLGDLTGDDFVLTPLLPSTRCTPESVISHSLYENPDAYLTPEPAGTLDASKAWYRQEPDGISVRIGGSAFHLADKYTVRLEGVERAGYRSLVFGAIRDTVLLRQLDSFCATLKTKWQRRVAETFPDEQGEGRGATHLLIIRLFGVNAAMGGREPNAFEGHEVGMVLEAVARTQERAHTLTSIGQNLVFHAPVQGWSGQVSNLAFPYSPSVLDAGAVYRFSMNHIIELADPRAPFPVEVISL
jgi:hypothetical protein